MGQGREQRRRWEVGQREGVVNSNKENAMDRGEKRGSDVEKGGEREREMVAEGLEKIG